MGNDSFLSKDLIDTINKKNYTIFIRLEEPSEICSTWLDSEDIGLTGAQASEWDLFCKTLMGAGVQIIDRQDELRWTRGDNLGILSVRNVYSPLATKLWQQSIGGW